MKFKTLSIRILGRFVGSMKGMKGCINTISQMEKVMPSFEYEPLVLSPKLETSNEEENRGDTYGVGPSCT
jgi:hypothetical protein